MTNAQQAAVKNGLKYATLIVGVAVTFATSAAMMRRDVDGKEDRTDHAADMHTLEASLRDEANARLLQHVHDSALVSVVLDRVNDIACQQNPSRRYCR